MQRSPLPKFAAVCVLSATIATVIPSNVSEAGLFLRTSRVSPMNSQYWPVGGYGANLHRNFVLKRDLRRLHQGMPVTNRPHLQWRRR